MLLDAAKTADDKPAPDSVTVKVVGLLRTGIVAIGGETTGTTITAKGVTWELDLGRNSDFGEIAKKLNGKQATVTGSLERKMGVEIPSRFIVTVISIE